MNNLSFFPILSSRICFRLIVYSKRTSTGAPLKSSPEKLFFHCPTVPEPEMRWSDDSIGRQEKEGKKKKRKKRKCVDSPVLMTASASALRVVAINMVQIRFWAKPTNGPHLVVRRSSLILLILHLNGSESVRSSIRNGHTHTQELDRKCH